MIVDERMVTFINSLDEGHTEFLEQLEKEAREDAVPIVRREMPELFKVSDGSCPDRNGFWRWALQLVFLPC